ncbi:MAG: homoserine kinase [Candidatus Marinimicrobia bacterium]|nr:homoserine kinase [Candidatus Neomarinimicrobiota bacterium]
MKTERISAFAPASIGNVSVGFDCLGLALERPGDIVSIETGSQPGAELVEVRGDGGLLPRETARNTAGAVVQKMLETLGRSDALAVRLIKNLPLESGLGSSAASSAAAAVAANAFLGYPFSRQELLPFAMEGERIACGAPHADNAAPALLGGITLIRSDDPADIISIPYPDELYCALIHPDIKVATRHARSVLPAAVPREVAIRQSSHLAAFVSALHQSDWELLARSMVDFIAEPFRKKLLPHFDDIKSAVRGTDALGCGISGSGPSIFALCKGKASAERTAAAMGKVCETHKILYETYVSAVNGKGAELVKETESEA